MAATGILAEAITAIKNAVTALGLTPVTDPRYARPFTVLIELPTMDTFTYNIGDIRVPIKVIAPPPGNQEASDYLITTVDTIMNSSIAITDARPGLANYGGQDLPTYEMTVAVAVKRS